MYQEEPLHSVHFIEFKVPTKFKGPCKSFKGELKLLRTQVCPSHYEIEFSTSRTSFGEFEWKTTELSQELKLKLKVLPQ